MQDAVKKFWDEQAERHCASPAATTNDVHLRDLEIRTLTRLIGGLSLPAGGRVLDLGCGDGHATTAVAAALPHLRFRGVDFSEPMIALAEARRAARPDLQDRLSFAVGDVTASPDEAEYRGADVAVTDRCLINLTRDGEQARAIAQIAACIRPGGHYLAIENFVEGQDAMNQARQAVGLPPIAIRWHNRYFDEAAFRAWTAPYFELLAFDEFASAYYFATRVVYAAMCHRRGEAPRYDHEIHQLAVDLPATGRFSPVRLAILQRRG